ncbi:MAG: hypothetical protein R3E86_13125 [Pseudomonadales bacterium]
MTRYRPGDVVARRKGLVMHKGVVLPDGNILHNTPGRGEHVSSPREFSAGRRLYVTSRRDQHPGWRPGVAPRTGARYNLFTNNCEHTVSRATHGQPESPQLRSWVVGLGIAALTFAVTRHPGATAAGYAMGRSVGRRLGRAR